MKLHNSGGDGVCLSMWEMGPNTWNQHLEVSPGLQPAPHGTRIAPAANWNWTVTVLGFAPSQGHWDLGRISEMLQIWLKKII